ncbi:MAG: sugar phosphate isomerase/epimerase family protein [Anaerolineales bacterium]
MITRLAFSTLACPGWPAEVVIERAAAYGYDAVEWRGGPGGHIRPDLMPARLAELRRLQGQAGLSALAVTAYTDFVAEEAETRRASLDSLQRHCDMAAELGAAYVRAFLGKLPAGVAPASVQDRAVACLEAAAGYAQSVGVTVALEPHDDFVQPASVAPLLNRVRHPSLAAVWDIGNAYSVGVMPADGLAVLGSRLGYVQVKDGRGQGDDWRLTPLGEGDVPLTDAIGRLLTTGYTGALSVEWEWAWHPELDPPETALPAALAALRRWLAAADSNIGKQASE